MSWKTVRKVDIWSQDNDIELDEQFGDIYRNSKGNNEGWEGIEKNDREQFLIAYNLAKSNLSRIKEGI